MTPDQLQAFLQELEKFRKHPFNKKHRIVRHSKYSTAWYLPLPHMPDGEFATAVYPEDFQFDREIPRMYTFRALLLQRLKDALAAEGFKRSAIYGVWGRWFPDKDSEDCQYQPLFNIEPDDVPETTALLKTIRQSDIWQEVEA